MTDRFEKDRRGEFDEVVLTGTAHLEMMNNGMAFLALYRPDGTGYGIWLSAVKGKLVVTWEER